MTEKAPVTHQPKRKKAYVARKPTMRQRIILLAQRGIIDAPTRERLLTQERVSRHSLVLVRAKLDEKFDDFLARSYDVARCRAINHPWEPYPMVLGYTPIGAYTLETYRCERCGAIRIHAIDYQGKVTNRRIIDYPSDFKISGRTTKSDWQSLLRSFLLKFEVESLEEQAEDAHDDPSPSATILSLHKQPA